MLELALLSGLAGIVLFSLLGKSIRSKTEELPSPEQELRNGLADLTELRRFIDSEGHVPAPRNTSHAAPTGDPYALSAMRAAAVNRNLLAMRAAGGGVVTPQWVPSETTPAPNVAQVRALPSVPRQAPPR